MQDYIYSAVAFVAIVIHLIINSNHASGRVAVAERGSREYRVFLNAIFAYYIVDVGWGVFAGLGWTKKAQDAINADKAAMQAAQGGGQG